jgi:Na+/H+ antiporter NhaC
VNAGWLSLLPAGLAIGLALGTRQVLPSLLAGIVVGAGLVHGTVAGAFFRALDVLAAVVADADKAKILLFTLTMGGLVGVVGASGGASGLAQAFGQRARSRRGAGLTTAALGLLFFFDDYASSLMVGTTMRPITDRLRISREKLSYIVDSTSAPVASLALVSTWVGYEVSVMQDALQAAGIDRTGYEVFLSGMGARFYPWLALWMVICVAWSQRDFGPMARAEDRAVRTGDVLRPGGQALMDVDTEPAAAPPRLWLGLLPVATLVVTVLAVLGVTGWSGAQADPDALARALDAGWLRGIGHLLGEAASFDALLYGSGSAALVAMVGAVASRACRFGPALEAFLTGLKATLPAVVVLVLAWGIGRVMADLEAGPFLAAQLGSSVPGWSLPTLVFLVSAGLAFATGTSWGTMAIVFPVAAPLIALHLGQPDFEGILLGSTASVLAGAVFGDHCSPISDTTVLSSVACAADHADHTRTQAPYALVVASVSVVLGTLGYGFGLPSWAGLGLGAAALTAIVFIGGRRPGSGRDRPLADPGST